MLLLLLLLLLCWVWLRTVVCLSLQVEKKKKKKRAGQDKSREEDKKRTKYTSNKQTNTEESWSKTKEQLQFRRVVSKTDSRLKRCQQCMFAAAAAAVRQKQLALNCTTTSQSVASFGLPSLVQSSKTNRAQQQQQKCKGLLSDDQKERKRVPSSDKQTRLPASQCCWWC
mgnify:CR=1 FL=1